MKLIWMFEWCCAFGGVSRRILPQAFVAAAFAAFLLHAPAAPAADTLGGARAAADTDQTTLRIVYWDYSKCISALRVTRKCDALYSRNAWHPKSDWGPDTNEVCGASKYLLEGDDKNGNVLTWIRLFHSERCRILGFPHFTPLEKDLSEYDPSWGKTHGFRDCVFDRDVNYCLEIMGRAAWMPERHDDPNGSQICALNADILELVYNREQPLEWQRLFYNERCQRFGLPYFIGTSKDAHAFYHFTDWKWGFSIDFPAEWTIIPSGSAAVRLKVVSPEGFICSVIVRKSSEWLGKDPARMVREDLSVRRAMRLEYEAELARTVPRYIVRPPNPDYTYVGGFGASKDFGRWTLRATSTFSDGIGGNEIKWRISDTMTWHEGRMYKISCISEIWEYYDLEHLMFIFYGSLEISG